MSAQRTNWSRHVDGIIRSRHYTWIGEGLAGRDVPDALTQIITDVMHICRREGISLDDIIAEGQRRAETEASTANSALN